MDVRLSLFDEIRRTLKVLVCVAALFVSLSSIQAETPAAPYAVWTPWMTDGDGPEEYHAQWLAMTQRGYYSTWVEGRNMGDHSEYRAFFLPFPVRPFAYRSFHGLTIEGYVEAVSECAGMGYELVCCNYFFDHDNILRFSVAWVKTRESFKQNGEWLDRGGQRRMVDQTKYPDLFPR